MFEHNHIPEIVAEVVRGKALARIVEGATVTDASGNVVDLKNLRPDGTIGDPGEPRPRRTPRRREADRRGRRRPTPTAPSLSARASGRLRGVARPSRGRGSLT